MVMVDGNPKQTRTKQKSFPPPKINKQTKTQNKTNKTKEKKQNNKIEQKGTQTQTND